jgi:cell volume regulation protein A
MRRVRLPSEGLYPLRTLATSLVLYGVATVAHGSGFLAVFLAGIVIGDARAPFKREVERFHSALSNLAEIVAFVVLGMTVELDVVRRADVWVPGLVLAVVLAVVIRPVLVGGCLLPARLRRNERRFVLFAGLKGAVPLLLGQLMLGAGVDQAHRLYGMVAVVVVFSVLVQGSLTPAAAQRLRVPMRPVDLEPWAMGVRLQNEPEGVNRFRVGSGAAADGRAIGSLHELPDPAWISVVVRDGALLLVTGDTQLRAGDEVVVLGEPGMEQRLRTIFEGSPA